MRNYKRIAATLLCLLVFLTACSGGGGQTERPAAEGKEQLVLALDPMISLGDGTALSPRRDIAASMASDVQSGTAVALTDTTDWQWIHRSADGEWQQRRTRAVVPWQDGAGRTAKNVPYAYTLNADGTSSLAVYDASAVEMEGYGDGELTARGVLFSVTGAEEEALCYTAPADETVILSETGSGKIALVRKISDLETGALPEDEACGALVRIYRNNRLLWQATLGNAALLGTQVTAVDFPLIENVELTAGDSLLFTVTRIDATVEGDGYAELPAGAQTSDVTKPIKVRREVTQEVPPASTAQAATDVPLLVTDGVANFTLVRPAEIDASAMRVVNDLRARMQNKLNADISLSEDTLNIDGYKIYVYQTSDSESKKALAEIRAARSAHAGDFIIRMVGERLIIAADNPVGLQLAVDTFLSKWCTGPEAKIPATLNYISSRSQEVGTLPIDGVSAADYRLVVANTASRIDRAAADYLQREITRLTGRIPSIVTDATAAAAREIVLGTTNRTSGSYAQTSTKTTSDDYQVTLSNGKVLLAAGSSAALNAGTVAFAADLAKKGSVAAGYRLAGSYDGGYSLTDGYKLTWFDEFNGEKLSRYWAANVTNCGNSVRGGTCYHTLSASFVDPQQGVLVQRTWRDGNDFYGTLLRSLGSQRTLYKWGYIETRVKLPTVKGVWSGFWINGDKLYGGVKEFLEMDIFEMSGTPLSIIPNLHLWGDNHHNLGGEISNWRYSFDSPTPVGEVYHTVGAEWTDNYVDIYVDGNRISSFDCSDNGSYSGFDLPLFVCFDALAGGTALATTNYPAEDFTEARSEWDWVRLYQKADDGSFLYVANS